MNNIENILYNFKGELLEKNFKGIILMLKNLNQLTHNYFPSNKGEKLIEVRRKQFKNGANKSKIL